MPIVAPVRSHLLGIAFKMQRYNNQMVKTLMRVEKRRKKSLTNCCVDVFMISECYLMSFITFLRQLGKKISRLCDKPRVVEHCS